MSNNTLYDEIKNAFAEAGLVKVDKDIMKKCEVVASTLHLSAEQIANCWEAFSVNKDIKDLNDKCFETFKNELIKEAERSSDITQNSIIDRVSSTQGAVMTRPAPTNPVTPPAKRFHSSNEEPASSKRAPVSLPDDPSGHVQPSVPSSESGGHVGKYNERKGAGQVVATFAASKVSPISRTFPSRPRCCVSLISHVEPYKHMFTTVHDRATALDEHMDQLGQQIIAMVERYQLDESAEVTPMEGVGVPRPEKVCCIGRICNAAHQGRINSTSVLLEGSRSSSSGTRIELDLSHLQTPFSIFPGQIVAVEGMNPSGRKLTAHRIWEGAAADVGTSKTGDLKRFHYENQEGQPLLIMAAAGPFTTSENLEYEPFSDLLVLVQRDKPDVVIFMGPFVDMRHPLVKNGRTMLKDVGGAEVIVPPETVFLYKIKELLDGLYEENNSLRTQFVLLPSLDDATAEWVYPQPPFKDRILGGKTVDIPGGEDITIGSMGLNSVAIRGEDGSPRVHCLPNPCTLAINEMLIGITSTDVLFHMSTEETNANLEPGTRMARISQHLLQQRSYYPLFPAPPGVNLDLKQMEHWKMPCQPDLLILPSKLACFARTVLDHTVVINPGHLTRESSGGTYAVIKIHPLPRENLDNVAGEKDVMQHSMPDRCEVEIKKI